MGHCFTFVIGVLCIIYISGQATQKVCWDSKWYNDSGILSNRSNYEHQTVQVLKNICTNGPVIAARCKDNKGEAFEHFKNDSSSHYFATCGIVNGLNCQPYKNEQKALCPDFAIQYGCNCPPTTTPGSKTTQNICWDTKWYNDSGILSNRSNYEHQTVQVLNQTCTIGSVVVARCKDDKGEAFQGTRNDSANQYLATCDTVNGLVCHPYKNANNATCPDFAIQYGCNCPPTTTTRTGRTSTAGMQGGGTKIVSSSVRTHGTTQGAIISSTGTGNNSKGITTMKTGGRIERGSTTGKGGSGSTGSQATGSGTGPSASGQRNNHCRNNGETYKTSQSLVLLCMIVFKVYC